MLVVAIVSVFAVLRWSVKQPAQASEFYNSIEQMFLRGDRR